MINQGPTDTIITMGELTAKQAKFVEEYLVDLNATQAAIRAGYSSDTARAIGCENLTKPDIAEAIASAQQKRSERTEITQDMVLAELWAIASANPNDLIQYRRGACPDCYGEGDDVEEELEPQAHGGALKRTRKPPSTITDEEPNPDCPTCGGEGMGRPFVSDTRALMGPAAKLYAGVKVTKEGIEVKMHDKVAALTKVGQHLGMFTDRVEHTGKGGGPIETVGKVDLSGLTLEQKRALASIKLPE